MAESAVLVDPRGLRFAATITAIVLAVVLLTSSAIVLAVQAAVFATNSGARLMNAGDLDAAISQFRAAIAATPGYAPAHYQLGLALQRKGEREESGRELKKAAELDPRLKATSP